MSTRRPKGSAPSLLRDGSLGTSLYGDSTDKDFDPSVLFHSPPPPPSPTPRQSLRKRGFFPRLVGWPAIAILGQLLLQGMGWTFFVVVKARGQVALPLGAALWVKNNGHSVTLFATLIATILGACSSFLFSYAIRRSMSIYLNRPVSLATLGASVSISMRSVVFHRRSWKWPLVSLFFFILAGIQTSGWSTLLTPVTLTVSTPLAGSEMDLSSPKLLAMVNMTQVDDCYGGGTRTGLFAGEMESGYAAARARLGQPSTFTLMDEVFNVSTGGILPAYLSPINASAWFTNTSIIPVTTHYVSKKRYTNGFSTNYSMTQQGFTADVSCKFRNLTNATTPSLIVRTDWVNAWHLTNLQKEHQTLHVASLNVSSCFSGPGRGTAHTNSSTYTGNGKDWMSLLACGPTNNYTVILVANGDKYGWIPMTVCSVIPKITTIHVDYTPEINARADTAVSTAPDDLGPTSANAIQDLVALVDLAQGLSSHIMGDQLTAVRSDLEGGIEDILSPIEGYIQGVMEYSGSVFRGCLTSNASFMAEMPDDMMKPTTGVFRTETLGWMYASSTTRWVLVPGTLLALATIFVVMFALYRHAGDLAGDSDRFDPSDPLHLVAAAAAGGLNNAFKGIGVKDMKEGEKLDVVLGSIPGRGLALVRADQYRPVSDDSFSMISGPESR
ncbi:hypothetical protein B0H15DRAFT_863429 [Mycena belliarum]|uniref:Uncharacterized protein n=1 Tax=Mycena belliarum TaxID=1033014 RepID=A0AAD6TWC7_9AGAR|nr:hypothetical protein B0H15DRAFT_863429 [Mycena belliae]